MAKNKPCSVIRRYELISKAFKRNLSLEIGDKDFFGSLFMRVFPIIDKFLTVVRLKKHSKTKDTGKEFPHPDDTGPDPLTISMSKARKDFFKAREEAQKQHFHQCLDTLDKAISINNKMYYTDYLVVQAYALFRLGRDQDAYKTAKEAYELGGANRFVAALACGDMATRAKLRASLPICTT